VISSYDLLLRDEHFANSVVPELVLRFGEMPTSKPLRAWLTASGADQIVIDPRGGWNEPTRRAAAILRADPTELASGWAARLEGEERPAPETWIEAERAARETLAEALGAGEMNEPALHFALGQAHGDGDLVYTASSMPIRDQEAFLPSADADVIFLCNRGANGIDGLVSSGIGAAHASGRPTTIVTGDLGLLHDVGGLAALRDVSTPVRVLVIDNDGGGIFHFLPQAEALAGDDFEALLGTPRGVDVARAAALFDLPHRRLESLDELPDALAAGTGLIEVKIDRDVNVDLHRRLYKRVADALR
jgi:2-succinyl-5-enolpyruvyl-6-hydroxy-3-cyclohexene-1-carboxylate synthase